VGLISVHIALEELRRKNENHLPFLRFYVEFPDMVPEIELDYSMVFVKLFVPQSQSIRYATQRHSS
jgi:hypothetical protein